jgi:hypothetical protein
MSYIYMKKHHKEDNLVWGSIFRKISVRGSIPKDNSTRRSNPGWEVTFSINVKGGEIYQMHDRELYAWRERT